MSRGARDWSRDCPICGRSYRLTNWMRRHHADLSFVTATGRRVWLTDTHLQACAAKQRPTSEPGRCALEIEWAALGGAEGAQG